ncbi:hypothetical protein DPMN_013202 [Dreissena polymorpha]|uniref:Uncharacterized protein n=1 Tax=Dreissena polymorpha TaxID=45954 RepID=A0A9D4N9G9_DREPO|nr:hypothetical protein DPMN_013202 [Dreissena polymorpha]
MLTLWLITTRLFTCFHYIHIEKTAPTPVGHVFPPIMTIFELVRDIYKIDAKNVTPRPYFLLIQTIFELNLHIQKTHVLTKFHEDWTKNVTSTHIENTAPPSGGHISIKPMFTKFHDDWAKIGTSRVNTAPPPGGHLHEDRVSNVTSTVFRSFELKQTINVASEVFTRQMLTMDDAQRTKGNHKS